MGLTWSNKMGLVKTLRKKEGLCIKDAVKKANRLISNSYRITFARIENRKSSIVKIYNHVSP